MAATCAKVPAIPNRPRATLISIANPTVPLLALLAAATRRAVPLAVLLLLAACAGATNEGGVQDTAQTPQGHYEPDADDPNRQTIFGAGGLNSLFSDSGTEDQGAGSGGIGVNAFLWRASLDTFAFLPPFSADPMGGVIIYDWYAPPETPGERMKVAVYILDTRLRADAVTVSVNRQLRGADGNWYDAPVDPGTPAALEDAILTRARQLRIAQLGQ